MRRNQKHNGHCAMKGLPTIFSFSLLLSTTNSGVINHPLIKDYLQWNNIRAALFVTCGDVRTESIEPDDITDIRVSHQLISMQENLSDFNYQQFFVRTSYPICVIVNSECNQTHSLLKEMSKRKMFHYERHWLMFGNSAAGILNILSEENINIDAEVAIAVRIDELDGNEYEINMVYSPSHKHHGRFRMETIGNWKHKTGLKMIETKTKFQRRQDLDGITFVGAIAIPKIPMNKTLIEHIDSEEFPYLDSLSRSSYHALKHLMEMFNFKMSIRRIKNWGGLNADGEWIGLVGLLNRSEIDVTISGVRWDVDRYGVFDQTTDSFYVQILFIFRHPKTVDALSVFLSPFVVVVWLLIFTVAIFMWISLTNFLVIENLMEPVDDETSYSNCFLTVFGVVFQQGSLLMEAPKTIKTMRQLLNSRLDFAMDDVPYVRDFFQHIREENSVKMYQKIMSQQHPLIPLYQGLNLVKQGSLAFNTDGTYAFEILKSLLTDDELCDLQEVKYAPRIPTGPGLPTKSPLREIIKIGIRKLYETGLLAHNWKIWMAHLPACARSDVDVAPIDINHFSSALYALGLGMQISIGILMGELFLEKFRIIKSSHISLHYRH